SALRTGIPVQLASRVFVVRDAGFIPCIVSFVLLCRRWLRWAGSMCMIACLVSLEKRFLPLTISFCAYGEGFGLPAGWGASAGVLDSVGWARVVGVAFAVVGASRCGAFVPVGSSCQSAFLRDYCADKCSALVTWKECGKGLSKLLSIPALLHFNEFLIYNDGKLYLNYENGDTEEEENPHSESSKESFNITLCPQNSPACNFAFLRGGGCSVPKIQVCVRKRPLSIKEISQSDPDVIEISQPGHVTVNEPHYLVDLSEFVESHTFRLDHTFDETVSTTKMLDHVQIYQKTAAPLVRSIFQGSMATCFAYGQTGSGKTFTMSGPVEADNTYRLLEKGLYGMVVNDIFELLESGDEYAKCSVTVAFFEIYCNRVYDLLNRRSVVRVLEDASGAVRLLGLSEIGVDTSEETLTLLKRSCRLRTSGQTALNLTSSRSHAIFQISLRSGASLIGRFSLVDLAGNERGSDLPIAGAGTSSSIAKRRRIESGEINKSLLALKECIRAMCRLPRRSRPPRHLHSRNHHHQLGVGGGGAGATRLPFRNSKLTQVLRESFVGRRARTCMIATVAPGLSCAEHSLNTLRYAQLVKRMPPFECWPKVAAHTAQVARSPTLLSLPTHPSVDANTNGVGGGAGGGVRRSCSQGSFESACSCCLCSVEDSCEVSVKSSLKIPLFTLHDSRFVTYIARIPIHLIWANLTAVGDAVNTSSVCVPRTFSDLVSRHQQLLKKLPTWVSTHQQLLERCREDPKAYTEKVFQLTSKQIRHLADLRYMAQNLIEVPVRGSSSLSH
uniref:Kinesin-like protein n=1 Tax=Echinococcus canadensis TaxID=519352 RepID=A0A915EXK8_9CEST